VDRIGRVSIFVKRESAKIKNDQSGLSPLPFISTIQEIQASLCIGVGLHFRYFLTSVGGINTGLQELSKKIYF